MNKKYPIPPEPQTIPYRLYLTISKDADELPKLLPTEEWYVQRFKITINRDEGTFSVKCDGTLPENFGEGLQDA